MKRQKVKQKLDTLITSSTITGGQETRRVADLLEVIEGLRQHFFVRYGEGLGSAANLQIGADYYPEHKEFTIDLFIKPADMETKKLLQKYVKLADKLNGKET